MKILYFVHDYPPSVAAAAINSSKIVDFLSKYGHETLVLAQGSLNREIKLSNPNSIFKRNVRVRYASSFIKTPFNLIFAHFENMAKFIIKLRKEFNPDIILSQYHAFHYASVVGDYIARIYKIPHIIRSHDVFFTTDSFPLPLRLFHSISYTQIYKTILNCDIFYVTTTEMKRNFLKIKKLHSVNFQVHPNGIDTNEFFPIANQEQLKGIYGCDNILLFIGTIDKEYGLQDLINIFPTILKNNKDTHLVIIGEGRYKNEIISIINKNALNKNVHIMGIKQHKEMPFYINNCDIGIGLMAFNPVLRYAIPVKCLEYMACKKVFITAPCSNDIIKNNDVGILLKRNFTKKDLAENITSLIEDKSLRKKLSENGLKKVIANFNWETIMKKFNDNLYYVLQKD